MTPLIDRLLSSELTPHLHQVFQVFTPHSSTSLDSHSRRCTKFVTWGPNGGKNARSGRYLGASGHSSSRGPRVCLLTVLHGDSVTPSCRPALRSALRLRRYGTSATTVFLRKRSAPLMSRAVWL